MTNFILDTDFDGLEVDLQGGMTDRGDNENYERGRLRHATSASAATCCVSGSYADRRASTTIDGRDWYQSWGAIGAGQAARLQIHAEHASR